MRVPEAELGGVAWVVVLSSSLSASLLKSFFAVAHCYCAYCR